jgi:DNA invertase Pin-like site-specific DNA recombinase
LMLTVLGGLAEFERELIRTRTGKGRTRAVANGIRLGRKVEAHPSSAARGNQARDHGEAVREIARS